MRGKTKIGTSALMLSVILMALAIIPASANPTATLTVPTLVNPLLNVGDTFTIDIVIEDVELLWSFEFKVAYDTEILTCVDYAPVRAAPVGMINMLPSGVEDEAGYMYMGATRKVDDTDGFSTEDATLLCLITFSIDNRGESGLVMFDLVLTDINGSTLDAVSVDGYFSNKFHGYIGVPHIIDLNAIPGSHVDIDVYVREITKLWGAQFTVSVVDPNMLIPTDFECLSPLDNLLIGEIGPDFFNIVCHSYMGDPDGLTTFDPYAIVRLGFNVVGTGVTRLALSDIVMADADGNKLILGVDNPGSFANTYDIAVALDTGFVEDSKYVLSEDPDGLITLTGQIKNAGTGITTARVIFTVQTSGGTPVGDALFSDEVSMIYGGQVRLSADLDASGLYGLYDVAFRVEYLDATGHWVSGQKGSPTANRSTMIKHFTVEP